MVSAATQASSEAVPVTCPQRQHIWRGDLHKHAVGDNGSACLGKLPEQATQSKMFFLTLDLSVGGLSGIECGGHVRQDSCARDRIDGEGVWMHRSTTWLIFALDSLGSGLHQSFPSSSEPYGRVELQRRGNVDVLQLKPVTWIVCTDCGTLRFEFACNRELGFKRIAQCLHRNEGIQAAEVRYVHVHPRNQ